MRITVISVGDKMPRWVSDCCDDYYRRLPASYQLQQLELPMEKRSKNQSTDVLRQRDTQRLLDAVSTPDRRSDIVVALDERGKSYTTQQFSDQFQRWQDTGSNVSFLIGGPDGIDFSQSAKQREHWPDLRWSLSALTFPHPMVRVILAEQLYRVWSVVAGHPYHRE